MINAVEKMKQLLDEIRVETNKVITEGLKTFDKIMEVEVRLDEDSFAVTEYNYEVNVTYSNAGEVELCINLTDKAMEITEVYFYSEVDKKEILNFKRLVADFNIANCGE